MYLYILMSASVSVWVCVGIVSAYVCMYVYRCMFIVASKDKLNKLERSADFNKQSRKRRIKALIF